MNENATEHRSNRTFLAIAATIVLVALVVRVYRIGEPELRFDEAYSFSMVALPNWLPRALVDVNPPLYYLVLRMWSSLFGQSEAALRALSAGLGTLFVAAVIWAGREMIEPRAALWSGAFAALAPQHLYYSQDARAYTLLMLALVLASVALWRAMNDESWKWWVLASACAVVALYTHYFALLGLLPAASLFLFWPDRQAVKRRWRRFVAAALISGALFLPWLLWAFVVITHPLDNIAWIQGRWEAQMPLLAISASLETLGQGDWTVIGEPPLLHPWVNEQLLWTVRTLGVVVLLLLGVCVGLSWGDSRVGVPWLGRRKAWLMALLAFPIAGLCTMSFYKPLYVVGRYDMIAFPAYALLVGLAFSKIRRVMQRGPLVAALLGIALFIPIGTRLLVHYSSPDDRSAEAVATVLSESVANDAVTVFSGGRHLTALYYLHRLGYRWQDGHCVNVAMGKRFSCRFFPPVYEQVYFALWNTPGQALRTPKPTREYVEEYFTVLFLHANELWVVLEGKRGLSENDDHLLRALARWDYGQALESGTRGVLLFRRS